MALQTQRRTKSSKKRRASHFALKKTNFTTCSHCQKPVRPHYACPNCGYYKGREVVKIETSLDKKSRKSKKKK
jgi:large subunit ribosomal protein L32